MMPYPKIPKRFQPYLRIGTCSWKYDSWKGIIYQPDKDYRPFDYLEDYAKYFNTVEIDQWFWSLFPQGARLPDVKTVKIYSESVPKDFLFTIKAPNSITLTNYYAKQPQTHRGLANQPNPYFLDVDLFKRFLETLEPMKGKLGPIMFQFEYLNKKKMPSKEAFLEYLNEFFEKIPTELDYAIETRNPRYLAKDFFKFLKDRKLGCVSLEGYYMPFIGQVAARFNICTAGCSIVRLHGPDRQAIEKQTGSIWNEIVDPRPKGLKATASIINNNTEKKITTFVNINNHYEGSAPLTINRLVENI